MQIYICKCQYIFPPPRHLLSKIYLASAIKDGFNGSFIILQLSSLSRKFSDKSPTRRAHTCSSQNATAEAILVWKVESDGVERRPIAVPVTAGHSTTLGTLSRVYYIIVLYNKGHRLPSFLILASSFNAIRSPVDKFLPESGTISVGILGWKAEFAGCCRDRMVDSNRYNIVPIYIFQM